MHKLSRILIVYVLLAVVACGQVTEDSEVVLSDDASQSGEVASGSVMLNEDKGDTVSSSESSIGSLVDSPSGGAFRRLWADPPTLDPHLTSDTTSAGIVVEVFSGLVALDTDLNLVPDIAEGWSIDGNTYTFNLRDNVKFHNGRQVKAEDFKWSIERAADPVTASPVADTYLNDIVGAMEYIRGEADSISGIKVIDDLTLQITVDAPKAYFLAKMTYPTAYVVDRNVVEAGGRNWWVGDPIGTGPFKLDEYRIGERIILLRNDDYYREPPTVARIDMNLAGGQAMAMYENDEIDITGVSLFDLERVLDPEEPLHQELVVAPPGFTVSYIGFNTKKEINGLENPLSDRKFRQALNHAVDKELIAKEVLSDLVQPAYGILPPRFPGYNPDVSGLRFDPELAVKLVGESGYPDYLKDIQPGTTYYDLAQELLASNPNTGSGTPRIVITVPGTGGTVGLDLDVIIEMWRQTLGIVVEIDQAEWATYLEDLDRKKFQAFAGLGWSADYPDPQDFLDILFHSESSINHNGYSNPEVDSILEAARIEQDPVARVQMYHVAENMILEDAAWVPLWFTGDRYALVKSYVKGYKLTPMIVPKLSQIRIE